VKPQNETEIKVIDFGSSCYEHQRGTFDLKLFSYLLTSFFSSTKLKL